MMQEEDVTTPAANPLNPPTIRGTSYGLGARGIDRILPWTRPSGTRVDGTPAYPVYDGHGNMILTLTRNAGSGNPFVFANDRAYDVWGGVRSGSATGDPSQRYCANLGHVQDDESAMIYMRARYYEPSTGRFISEDPARDGSHWFVYARSSPTNYCDPSGCVAGPWSAVVDFILRVAKTAGWEYYPAAAVMVILGALGDAQTYWTAANAADTIGNFALGASGAFATGAIGPVAGPGLFALGVGSRLFALVARIAILYTVYDMLVRLWLLSNMDEATGVTPWELEELAG